MEKSDPKFKRQEISLERYSNCPKSSKKKPIVTKVSQNLLLARFLIQQTHPGGTMLNSGQKEKDEETVSKYIFC